MAGPFSSPIAYAGPALSLIGGLLGGKRNFGSQQDLSAGRNLLGQAGGVSNQFDQLGNAALGQYGGDNAAARQATSNYADLLGQDPYTDSYSAAALGNATRGTTNNYLGAQANLQNSMLSRGLGMDSSAGVGGLASLGAAQAGQISGAQNQLAMNQVAQRRANLGQLTGLLGGQAQTDYSRGTGALGQAGGMYQSLGSADMNQGNAERGMELGYEQQGRQMIGQAGQGLGSLYGMNQFYNSLNPQNQSMGGFGGSGLTPQQIAQIAMMGSGGALGGF